ncbi:MAG: hypothetical protein ABFD92_16305 [Planctomycetaceae bacterium]|nr:hypothetical protein [Planctomycetaceae bacterium]
MLQTGEAVATMTYDALIALAEKRNCPAYLRRRKATLECGGSDAALAVVGSQIITSKA